MNRTVIIALISGLVALGGWFYMSASPETAIMLKPNDPLITERGAVVYRQHCADCHGANLEGQPDWRVRGDDGLLPAPPHDPSGHTWHHPDGDLFALTKLGIAKVTGNPAYQSAMPAYGNVLSDEEIIAVLSYIKSTWPTDIQAHHDRINARNAPQ